MNKKNKGNKYNKFLNGIKKGSMYKDLMKEIMSEDMKLLARANSRVMLKYLKGKKKDSYKKE